MKGCNSLLKSYLQSWKKIKNHDWLIVRSKILLESTFLMNDPENVMTS